MLKSRFTRWLAIGIGAIAVAVAVPAFVAGQRGLQEDEWRAYAGDTYSRKYSPLNQITKENIQDLRVVWRSPVPDREAGRANPVLATVRNESTPLMVNGALYHVSGLGQVSAIDPGTGQTRWTYDPEGWKAGRPNNGGFMQRGMGYWSDGKIERLLVGTHDMYLISIDARTGKPDPGFGNGGRADLTVEIRDAVRSTIISSRSPLVAGNVVVVGSSIMDVGGGRNTPPGYVHAFDVRTGKRLWTFHTVPKPGEFGYETWLNGSAEFNGAANVWGGFAYDPELDYVYMPTSTASNDYLGVDRPGINLFAESLLCIEARTGKRVWHFQAVHHGLWDYDFPTHPVLGDITVDGRRIKAVMQVSKQGFTYVFDRKTGQPVWPIEERPVPQTTVPGEWTSPTQPFPTKPPAFDLQGAIDDNLLDFTPELRRQARERLNQFEHGPLFTPPTPRGVLAVPGAVGSANWGGAAFDPETGILYVPSRTTASLMRARPQTGRWWLDSPRGGDVPNPRGGGPGAKGAQPPQSSDDAAPNLRLLNIDGLPIFKPPYARVTAIDMNAGTKLWMSPLGNGPRNHPLLAGLNVGPLGDALEGQSALVTKSVLFVTVWRRQRGNNFPMILPWKAEYGDPAAARKILYAFDKQSGKLLREFEMDGHSAGAPMTYMHGGKQYIAIAVGGNQEAEIVALGL
jgi:quinoprotein glucose dehydrogenase